MNNATHDFLLALAQAFTALLIVLNPLGLLPVIASVTKDLEPAKQRRLIGQVAMIGCALLLVFTFGGTEILRIFNITADDLRVAGGLLLLSIAFSFVLKGSMSGDAKFQQHPSAAPIASPILVGPGAITTAVVLVKANVPHSEIITALAVILASFVTWLVLLTTPKVYAIIKETGADIIVRIMGILLAAIAVVYIRQGIAGLIHVMK